MKGNCGECERRYFCEIDPDKCNEWPDPVPQTNADRIRAMSDDELAKHFSGLICDINEGVEYHEAPSRWLEWLKQPAYEPPKEEAQQDCTYNKNGHCIGQKLMPECDAKNCDRRK